MTVQQASVEWPSVCALIPTRNRPALLRRAVDAILSQDYAGSLDVLIILDQTEAQEALGSIGPSPQIHILENTRSAGLAGARNTGILASSADLVAFCDDDDVWLPGKLRRQVEALLAAPDATLATCAVEVDYDDHRTVRRAGTSLVTHADLIPSRMSMLHSSTFVARRSRLVDDVGIIDEQAPGSHNEDWDLLLRASRHHPIVNVDDPLVRIQWSTGSFFSHAWEEKISSLKWMLDRHPEIATSRVGAGRVYGQIAFATAATGDRQGALRWATRALRRSWREPRAYIAVAVAAGVPGDLVMRELHKRGRGI
jgi:glycosyltransferase involved in cell wall biosynthesis